MTLYLDCKLQLSLDVIEVNLVRVPAIFNKIVSQKLRSPAYDISEMVNRSC